MEDRSASHFPGHALFPHGTAMPPCRGNHRHTDHDIEDHRSPVLLKGLGNGRSYDVVEQSPQFKNSHTQKAPPGKCLAEESIWNDDETWAADAGMGTPPFHATTALLPIVSPASSDPSQSPVKKTTQRNLDAELKGTQAPRQSKDTTGGRGSKSNKGKPLKKDYEFVCNSLLQVLMAQESGIAAVLKEQGRKKTKEQVLKDIMTAWARSGDKRMNNLSFTQVNHCCNNLIKAATEMVKEGLHERNAMLTENGNNASDGKLSDYDSSLVQLAVRIEKNQKREEAQKVEAAKEKADKAMRLSAKLAESSGAAACRERTDKAIHLVGARVDREQARRKRASAFNSDEDWHDDEDAMEMDVDDGDGSQLLARLEDDEEVKQNNGKPTHKPIHKNKALQSIRLTKNKKKPFNGAAFADDVEQEEHDFRATLQHATDKQAEFTKGLVAVKEYEAQTERLRVEQDKVKMDREEK